MTTPNTMTPQLDFRPKRSHQTLTTKRTQHALKHAHKRIHAHSDEHVQTCTAIARIQIVHDAAASNSPFAERLLNASAAGCCTSADRDARSAMSGGVPAIKTLFASAQRAQMPKGCSHGKYVKLQQIHIQIQIQNILVTHVKSATSC